MPWREILTWLIVLPLIPLNWAYWWFAMTRFQHRFRHYCERRFNVTIDPGARGYWRVSSGGPFLRNLGINQLQTLYILVVLIVWALSALVVVGGLKLLHESLAPERISSARGENSTQRRSFGLK